MADQTIYGLLEHDHREVEEMFRQIMASRGGSSATPAEAVFQKLTQELQRHMQAEEQVFYGELQGKAETKELVAEGFKEHREAAGILQQAMTGTGTPAWFENVAKLQSAIQHHVTEEEGQMFTAARKVLDQRQAVELGERFQQQKQKAG